MRTLLLIIALSSMVAAQGVTSALQSLNTPAPITPALWDNDGMRYFLLNPSEFRPKMYRSAFTTATETGQIRLILLATRMDPRPIIRPTKSEYEVLISVWPTTAYKSKQVHWLAIISQPIIDSYYEYARSKNRVVRYVDTPEYKKPLSNGWRKLPPAKINRSHRPVPKIPMKQWQALRAALRPAKPFACLDVAGRQKRAKILEGWFLSWPPSNDVAEMWGGDMTMECRAELDALLCVHIRNVNLSVKRRAFLAGICGDSKVGAAFVCQELPKLMAKPNTDDRMLMFYALHRHATKADFDNLRRTCVNRDPKWKFFSLHKLNRRP